MKNIVRILPVILLIALVSASCKNKTSGRQSISPPFSTYVTDKTGRATETGKKEIMYGLLTPTEITSTFSRLGISYEKTALNPTTNCDLYVSSAKASINLGIYGVDFGYVKMFSIGQQMIDYILTIKNMTNKLGIPDQYLMDPIKKVESDMSSPDTIMALLNKSYNDIENHLRKDGRESVAGLMLMGGWVESLYITTQVLYNPAKPDKEVIEKIAQQKYTLTSLLGFMRNYYDDPMVVFYTKKLIFLKRYFDTFDIYFKKGDLEIDTVHQVLRSSGSEITISFETLNKIRDYVDKLRTEMVTP